MPSVIKGDLDSLRDDVRNYYEKRDVKIIKDPDQNTGDLEKAMSEFYARTQNETHRPLIIFGGQSGRRDQTANVESNVEKRRLRYIEGRLVGRDIRIISDNNISWPLAAVSVQSSSAVLLSSLLTTGLRRAAPTKSTSTPRSMAGHAASCPSADLRTSLPRV